MVKQGKKTANKERAQIMADYCAYWRGGADNAQAASLAGVHWFTMHNWLNEAVAANTVCLCSDEVDPNALFACASEFKREMKNGGYGDYRTPKDFESTLTSPMKLTREELCRAHGSLIAYGHLTTAGIRKAAERLINEAFEQNGWA